MGRWATQVPTNGLAGLARCLNLDHDLPVVFSALEFGPHVFGNFYNKPLEKFRTICWAPTIFFCATYYTHDIFIFQTTCRQFFIKKTSEFESHQKQQLLFPCCRADAACARPIQVLTFMYM